MPGIPTIGADMDGFEWEKPTPGSFRADQDALTKLLAENENVKFTSAPPVPPALIPRPAIEASELEWT